ncbi:MAG TPA: M14 family metallopeptidase [Kofleriaceae bacterium]|nr:M14 family metallopeptidase [Kofleriaceae bacterium]
MLPPCRARRAAPAAVPLALAPLALLAACHATPRPAHPDLTTTAEATDWQRTGRYDEAVRLCHDQAAAEPARVRCITYGETSEHRPLVALVVSGDGVLTPRAAAARHRPVIMVQAGIHAGEIEGKDAGFLLVRELLAGKVAPGSLTAVTLVFVPVVNPDGHERWGANNRPNQRGPEEMGFRTTALNLNLNRDYVKADAPEMVALLGLFGDWDPVVYVDLHTTDGAKFQHDVAVVPAPLVARGDGLEQTTAALSAALQARLTELHHLPLPFYPSFEVDDDPTSGFRTGDPPARFSHAYAAIRNRIGLLVETHSWKTYRQRAMASHDTVQALLELATSQAAGWRTACDRADEAARHLGGTDVALLSQGTDASAHTIDFLGYAYERRASEVSGGTWIVYDESKPEVWKVPLRDQVAPSLTVTAPRGGYVVPAAYAARVRALLALHRVASVPLTRALTVHGQVFHADKVEPGKLFEGREPVKVTGGWQPETVALAPGALWVPIAQPGARVILQLLEPTGPDSMVAWGDFNAWFEQKEYLEAYLAEQFARDLMAKDPAVKAEFEERLAKDPAFAADPKARLEFFARRHPSWDTQLDRVPIVKTDEVPAEAAPAAR